MSEGMTSTLSLFLLLAAACSTTPDISEQPSAHSAGLDGPPARMKGAGIAYRILAGPGLEGMEIIRHSVIGEREGELEVLTVWSHDLQERSQRRLIRIGPWDGTSGTGPNGEGVLYEEVIEGQRVSLVEEEGRALFARLDAALELPALPGRRVDVQRRHVPNIALSGVGPQGCIEETGRYDTGDPATDVHLQVFQCPAYRWKHGPARLWRIQKGAVETLWQRDVLHATSPGAWTCPATYAEAVSVGRQCPSYDKVGCMYPEGYCACSPEPSCSGVMRDPRTEPHFWICGPFPRPNPCGDGLIAPP